jgi:hypothetical protein
LLCNKRKINRHSFALCISNSWYFYVPSNLMWRCLSPIGIFVRKNGFKCKLNWPIQRLFCKQWRMKHWTSFILSSGTWNLIWLLKCRKKKFRTFFYINEKILLFAWLWRTEKKVLKKFFFSFGLKWVELALILMNCWGKNANWKVFFNFSIQIFWNYFWRGADKWRLKFSEICKIVSPTNLMYLLE